MRPALDLPETHWLGMSVPACWFGASTPYPDPASSATTPGPRMDGGALRVNAWNTGTVDEKNGLLYMTFDSPAADLYGADRPGNNLFGNTLVALDALTGKLKWYFQTTHHDIWDYDEPAQPTLVDVVHDGKTVPAIIQTGKTGLVFVLDRLTGKPIFPVEERAVPKGDVPGEWYSPTQPFPVRPAPLARMAITRNELARFTPEQKKFCEAVWDAEGGAHNDGAYTPVGMKPTVIFPGNDGGWGSGTVDPRLGYFFFNTQADGIIAHMIQSTVGAGVRTNLLYEFKSLEHTIGLAPTPAAYERSGVMVGGEKVYHFNNPKTGWPCVAPPWGELSAVNLNTGAIAWRIPFGRMDALEAIGVMNTGSFNKGGSVATAGGVLFIGATIDKRFHAFDSKTGKLLWETTLPVPAKANPITYLGKNNKQYVLIAADAKLIAFILR